MRGFVPLVEGWPFSSLSEDVTIWAILFGLKFALNPAAAMFAPGPILVKLAETDPGSNAACGTGLPITGNHRAAAGVWGAADLVQVVGVGRLRRVRPRTVDRLQVEVADHGIIGRAEAIYLHAARETVDDYVGLECAGGNSVIAALVQIGDQVGFGAGGKDQ